MGLSVEDARKRVSEARKRRTISLAILHQNRIRLHAEVVPSAPALASWAYRGMRKAQADPVFMGSAGVSQALWDFMRMVENIIPHDKFKTFCSLMRFPVKTNEVLGVAFDKLSRIFDGRNPAFSYQFASTEQRDDWEWYRQEVLHEPKIWQTKGWDFFKTRINSVLVVDLPEEQRQGAPEPYFYWLPIEDVIDYRADATTGRMKYICFRQDDDEIAVIDDESYRVFRSKDGQLGELLRENGHDLGYCPSRFFWSEPISLEEPDVKMSPVSKLLDDLDWYLFYSISKRYLDTYGSYPIYWGYEQNCDYHNDVTGDECDGGFLKDIKGQWKYDQNGMLMPCPKCHEKRISGPGSFVEVPIPIEGQPDLHDPVGMLSVDRASLDYTTEEDARLREAIITAIVGTNEEITTRDALNEQQIKANFESQSTVLNRVKKGFEEAQAFVDETCCRLRYGTAFLSLNINYGTEFYLQTSDELRERYKNAKESGASEADLDALSQQIIETEYRTNPQMMQRMIILSDLEPYRHLSREEVQEMRDRNLVSDVTVMVKMNFADYIRRFERENMNVTEFGETIPYERKIETVKAELERYAQEALDKVNNINPIKE